MRCVSPWYNRLTGVKHQLTYLLTYLLTDVLNHLECLECFRMFGVLNSAPFGMFQYVREFWTVHHYFGMFPYVPMLWTVHYLECFCMFWSSEECTTCNVSVCSDFGVLICSDVVRFVSVFWCIKNHSSKVCICDARRFSVSVQWERFQEAIKLLTQCGASVVFSYSRQKSRCMDTALWLFPLHNDCSI